MKHASLFITIILFSFSSVKCQNKVNNDIKQVQPFQGLRYTLTSKGKDKAAVLKAIDAGQNIPTYKTAVTKEANIGSLTLLDREAASVSIELSNASNGAVAYVLNTNLPQNWQVVIRKQALLNDYYSANRANNPDINFFGDALPKLARANNAWTCTLKPNEVARLFIEFVPQKVSSSIDALEVNITDSSGKNKRFKKIPFTVVGKKLPPSTFNSVVFNSGSYEMASYAGEWEKTGFTHQISYTYPTAQFDEKGNIVGSLNTGSAEGKQFRYVTDYWMKRGHSVLFYWAPRFAKLAPLANGKGYLEPYSAAWINAYVNLVKASFENIKARIPNVTSNKVLLYIHDEISSGQYADKASAKVLQVQSLLKAVKDKLPEFKTFMTYSMYSYPADLSAVTAYTDVQVPLIIVPEKLQKNAPQSYSPVKTFQKSLFSTNASQTNKGRIKLLKSNAAVSVSTKRSVAGQTEQWSYLVTQGKTSNILDFRALPIYAALLGREGLSWWAFIDTKGSSWLAADGKGMDYSLIYLKEPNNPLYNYYCNDKTERFIPSLRLYAARAGIQDAKILRYIIENKTKLTGAQQQAFTKIINTLEGTLDASGIQPDRTKYLSLDEYEAIGQQLRKIYVSL